MTIDGRQQIKEVIEKYTEENQVDLSRMRKEDKTSYGRISYYFGSIEGMLQELGLESKSKRHSGGSADKPSLRNQLAYDMLTSMLEDQNMTMEQVGQKYNCSRMHVSQLLKSLKIAVGETEK